MQASVLLIRRLSFVNASVYTILAETIAMSVVSCITRSRTNQLPRLIQQFAKVRAKSEEPGLIVILIIACECYGHASQCVYDARVAARNGSINAMGRREGGGVCVSCQHHTTGNNCDTCVDGYFRPKNVPRNATEPCRPCQCSGVGTTEYCIKDDSHILEGYQAGDCLCKTGYANKNWSLSG